MSRIAISCPWCGPALAELEPPAGPARCAEIVEWGPAGEVVSRRPGCGAAVSLCARCGLRTRWNGGPCSACLELPAQ